MAMGKRDNDSGRGF